MFIQCDCIRRHLKKPCNLNNVYIIVYIDIDIVTDGIGSTKACEKKSWDLYNAHTKVQSNRDHRIMIVSAIICKRKWHGVKCHLEGGTPSEHNKKWVS